MISILALKLCDWKSVAVLVPVVSILLAHRAVTTIDVEVVFDVLCTPQLWQQDQGFTSSEKR